MKHYLDSFGYRYKMKQKKHSCSPQKERISKLLVAALFVAAEHHAAAQGADSDRVMAFLHQNAPRETSPSQNQARSAQTTVRISQVAQRTQPSSPPRNNYEGEVRRLHAVASGSGRFRTPQSGQNDTIVDIKNYVAANTQPNMNCWGLASARYDLNPYLLYSIALVESAMNPHAISRPNSNRTHDIGLMQVNSAWLSSERFRQAGITQEDLRNPCINIHVGAWVLKSNINSMGYNWQAIGAYNAWKNRDAQLRYANKVYTMYGLVMESKNAGELHRDPLAPLRRYNELQRLRRQN